MDKKPKRVAVALGSLLTVLGIGSAALARTAQELRSGGITARTGAGSVSITDPDGTVLEFSVLSAGSQ